LPFVGAEAFTGSCIDGEAGGDAFGFGAGDGGAVEVSGLVRAVVAHEGVDAVGEVGGDGTEGVVVVPAALDHEALVEGGEVGVVLPGDVGGEVERPAEQGGAGFAERPRRCASPEEASRGVRPV
jgi:hypothetical protein